MTRDEFSQAVEFVTTTWPQAASWPDVTWERWFDELGRFPLPVVNESLRRLRREPFPPRWPDVEVFCIEWWRFREADRRTAEANRRVDA